MAEASVGSVRAEGYATCLAMQQIDAEVGARSDGSAQRRSVIVPVHPGIVRWIRTSLVSAVLVPAGNQAAILLLALRGQIAIYVSDPLLGEYEEGLRRPRRKLTPDRIDAARNARRKVAHSVSPRSTLSISPDDSDNRVLECAAAARADYLVTGNIKHFPLRLKNTVIVSGRQFLDMIADPDKQ